MFLFAVIVFMVSSCTGDPLYLHLLGTGYNILKGNPIGRRGHHLDPGLLSTKIIFQYSTDPRVITNTPLHSTCSLHGSTNTELIFGPKSYQSYLLQFLSSSGDTDGDLRPHAFSLNREYEDIVTTINQNHDIFRDELTSCTLGVARYTMPFHGANDHFITSEFADKVCNTLKDTYDEKIYTDFIDQWGTHIIVGMEYGNRIVNRYKQTPADIAQYMIPHYPRAASLRLEKYLGYQTVLNINTTYLRHADFTNIPKGQKYQTINYGDISDPEPIFLTLITLSKAFETEFWSKLPELHENGICTGNLTSLTLKKAHINRALIRYSTVKGAHTPSQDLVAKLPLTWPSGAYGLPKPKTGCPTGPFNWLEGSRFEDDEDDSNGNSQSGSFHLSGSLGRDTRTDFCIKVAADNSVYSRNWPAGNYCIYRKNGACPTGFSGGTIHTDDEDHDSSNGVSGTLPDGQYGHDTDIEYCCRRDESVSTPILLPLDKPFFLLRFGGKCQTVVDMTVTEEFRYFDDEDGDNGNSCRGSYPDGGCQNRDHTAYYCYYVQRVLADHIPNIIG